MTASGLRVIVTCPPMLRSIDSFRSEFEKRGAELHAPEVVQVMSEDQLVETLPGFDGWIIGDDPATARVFQAAKAGGLKAAVKWGVGVDNVDFDACRRLGIPISNTPGMFGDDVADVAFSYVVALARQTFEVDRGVRAGHWPKPVGISLRGRTAALVGFGDIGRCTARRLVTAGMKVVAYDPFYKPSEGLETVENARWPERIGEADFIVFVCALTAENRRMLDKKALSSAREGVRVVNVSRGPLIDETALVEALRSERVHSAALEVFEEEPLPASSPLRAFGDRVLFGAHNASNTADAVGRTSRRAIELLFGFLGGAGQ